MSTLVIAAVVLAVSTAATLMLPLGKWPGDVAAMVAGCAFVAFVLLAASYAPGVCA